MKKKRERPMAMLLAIMMIFMNFIITPVKAAPGDVAINEANFPDENFRKYVKTKDKDNNGILSKSELDAVTIINLDREPMTNLKGIEHFTKLKELYCIENKLKELDVKSNTKLTNLECNKNKLKTLDLSKNTELTYINCSENQLTALDLSKNTNLKFFDCHDNQLTNLDLKNNTNLETFYCFRNQLTTLDLTNKTNLKTFYCSQNQLTKLVLTNTTNLEDLSCWNNQLKTLNLSQNTNLKTLNCEENKLTALDLSNNTQLTKINCKDNQLAALDLGNNTQLKTLACDINKLTALDLSKNTELTDINCDHNKLTTLDLTNKTKLEYLSCVDNELTALDLKNNKNLKTLVCGRNQLAALDLKNNTELERLYCSYNQLTTLDLSQNKNLETLYCNHNQLTTLDLSQNTKLDRIFCQDNQLTSLDLTNNAAVTKLEGYDQVYDIKVDKSTLLFDLKSLPGNFDPSNSRSWVGGAVTDNTLKLNDDKPTTVTYEYNVKPNLSTLNVTLNVKYGDVVTVTFNKNGKGGDPATIVKTIDKGSKVEKPSDPTDTDYDFGGWYKEAACTNKFDFPQAVNDNITLYAKWTKKTPPAVETVTITFNANGHGTAPSPLTVNKGEQATAPAAPTDTDYDFGGWYKEAGCTNKFDFTKPVNGDITLFAKWTAKTPPAPETVTITFNENGHGTAPSPITVNKGTVATAPADPTDANYDFGGWYKEAGCTNKFDFTQAVNASITLYAKWTAKTPPTETVTITFNENGHGTAPSPITVNKGTVATAPTDPTDTENDFGGWYTEAGCTNKFDFTKPVNGDITLFAKWTAKTPTVVETVTITFDANGHGTAPSPITVNKGTVATAPADPTDTENDFGGWYKEAGCTNKFDFPQAVNENIRLYAKWTKKTPPAVETVTITFDANGHGTAPSPITVNKGTVATAPADPTDANYDFVGWYKEAECTTKFDFSQAVNANKRLYAKWTKKTPPPTQYTLTASVNGGHGSVSPTNETKNAGETVTLTFAPDPGYELDEVTVNDTETGVMSNVLNVTMDGDKTVVVKFKAVGTPPIGTPVTITFDKNGGNGTMADVTKNKGESFTLPACTFTPPAGKEFKAWQVDGTEKNVGDNIVLNGDKIIKAVWKDIGSASPTPPVPPTPYTPYPWIVYPGWDYNYEAPKPKEENKVTKMEMDWKIELTIGISTIDREINGVDSKIKMDVAPYIRDGRTMLPLRSVAEALGFDVEWNRSTKTVVLRNSSTRVEIPVDTNKIILNGTVYTSDVKPEIKNNRTMLTIANIARALGLRDGKDIIWNSKSKMVTIYRSIIVK